MSRRFLAITTGHADDDYTVTPAPQTGEGLPGDGDKARVGLSFTETAAAQTVEPYANLAALNKVAYHASDGYTRPAHAERRVYTRHMTGRLPAVSIDKIDRDILIAAIKRAKAHARQVAYHHRQLAMQR